MALFIATGRGGVNSRMQHSTTVWADCAPLCFFAAVWSWTSNSRRTSCSRWWRGSALRRTATSPPCLTPRRPSPPPRNASPKLTRRSMLAGNFGSCEHTGPPRPRNRRAGFMRPSGRPYLFALSIVLRLTTWLFADLATSINGALHHWILNPLLRDDRMCNGTQVWIPRKIQNVMLTKNGFWTWLFWTNFFKQGVKLHQGNIFGDQQGEKTNLISLYLHIFF